MALKTEMTSLTSGYNNRIHHHDSHKRCSECSSTCVKCMRIYGYACCSIVLVESFTGEQNHGEYTYIYYTYMVEMSQFKKQASSCLFLILCVCVSHYPPYLL